MTMDGMRNHSDEFRNQIDEEFELITLNDDGPDKFREVMEKLHEHGMDAYEWSPLKDPMPDQGYLFVYQEDASPKIQEIRGRELSYTDFMFSQLGIRSDDLMKRIDNRLDYLKTDPDYFKDCMEQIRQDMKESTLSDAFTTLTTKEGPYDVIWQYDRETDSVTISDRGGTLTSDGLKESLMDKGFFGQPATVRDVETTRLDQAYFAQGDKLEWTMHRILDEKKFDGIDSSTWKMEGRRGSFEVQFARNSRNELVMRDHDGKLLDRRDISVKGKEIGLDQRLVQEYRDERELDILERVKTAIDPEAVLSIVAGERGRNHAGPIRWTAQGEKDSVTFIIDGKSDGSPILKDDQDREYSFATMEEKLNEIGYLEGPQPDPVMMFGLEAKDHPQSMDSVHNNFFPEDRDKIDPKEVAAIRESNPLYGYVDGKVDVTKPCSRIQLDHSTVKNLMGEEFTDVKIKDVRAYIQNGRAMDVDGAKFGIMNRVYLNVDIDRDGKSENVRYQAVVRTDGAYIYGFGKTDGHLLHYKFPEAGERYASLDRLELSNPSNWFGKEVEKKMDALEKSRNPERMEQFQKSPTGQGLEAYKEAKDFIKAETGYDSISKGLNHLDSLPAQKQEVWKGIVEKYDTAVKKIESTIEKKFDQAARKVVSEEVDFRRSHGKMDLYFDKKLDFYINQRNDTMNTRDQLVTYRNIKLDQMYDFQHAFRDASFAITDHLAYGHDAEAKDAIQTVSDMKDAYEDYKQKVADVAKVQEPIARCESYLNFCDAVIHDTIKEMDFVDSFDIDQYDSLTSMKEYVFASSDYTDGTDMRDYSSVYSKDLELIDAKELQDKVEAYNEKQDNDYFKIHIGKDGGVYTDFGIRLSYSYTNDRSVRPHYYAADKNMKIEAASYRYKMEENRISPYGRMTVSENAPMIGRDENADYTNAFNVLRNEIPDTRIQLVDVLEQIDRNFLGERSAYQYDNVVEAADLKYSGDPKHVELIKDIMEHREDNFEKIKERYEEKVEQKPQDITIEEKPVEKQPVVVSMVDTPKKMPDFIRAKIDFGGELNIRNSKMVEIENEAKTKAKENGTDVDKEKEQIINGILKDAGPVVDRMKELAGKMNGMVERIGNPQIVRSNTFYQQYKMEFDFCAKKLIDSGIAWGDGQVVKEYVSKDMLRMDKLDVYRSNYMESYRDRIITGGNERIDTDSYIKGTTYDYSKWFKFGDFLAKTIYRPYFSSVEQKVDREPVEDRFEKKEDKEEPMQDHITQPVEELKDPSTEEPEKKAEMEKEEADTKDDAMALEDQRLAEEDAPDTQEDPVPEDTTQEDSWDPDTDDNPKEPDFDYQDIDLGEQDLWDPSEEGIQPAEPYEGSVESDSPYEEKEEWDPSEDVDSPVVSDSDSDPRIDMKADFDKVFDGDQTTDDVFDKYAEDVFVDESVDYDTLLQAASDSISEKLSLDAPDDEKEYYQQASADIAYEVTDLDGKPMENLDKMSSMLQENGISEEQADAFLDTTSDRYEEPEVDFSDAGDPVDDEPDAVDVSETDAPDLTETDQFLDNLDARADTASDAVEAAASDGVDVPEDVLAEVLAEDDPLDDADILERLKNTMMENGITDPDEVDHGLSGDSNPTGFSYDDSVDW